MLKDRWLREWFDDDDRVTKVIRKDGKYWLVTEVPAFEYESGKKIYRKLSLKEAQDVDIDKFGELSYNENEEAKIDNDPFFRATLKPRTNRKFNNKRTGKSSSRPFGMSGIK